MVMTGLRASAKRVAIHAIYYNANRYFKFVAVKKLLLHMISYHPARGGKPTRPR